MAAGAIAELVIRRDLGAAFPQLRLYKGISDYEGELSDSRKDFPREFPRPRAVMVMAGKSTDEVFERLERMIESEELSAGLSTKSGSYATVNFNSFYLRQKRMGELIIAMQTLGGQPYNRKK